MSKTGTDSADGAWERSIKEARAKFADVDVASLQQHIEREAAATSVEVRNLKTLTEGSGMSNGIAFFDAHINRREKSEDRSMVLRYSPGISLIRQKSFSDEYFTMRAVQKHGMPVPNAFWPDHTGDSLGVPGFIMDRVEADSVPSGMFASGPIAEASPADRKEMMLQAATLQGRLRRAAIPPESVPHLLKKGDGASAIEREVNWWYKEGQLSVPADDPKLTPITEVRNWLVANQPPTRPASLTHGDGQICNIMYRGIEAACWLDWELAYLGHQESDLMMIMMTTELTKPETPIEGVPSDSEYIARFEREAGSSVEYWEYFKLIMVFKYGIALLWIPDVPHIIHVRSRILEYLDKCWAEARGAARSYQSIT